MPFGLLTKFGGRALGQAVDPTNYKFLKEAAENVLSRTVPQGVNFGALPTQFLNTLTDIQQMAPGAAKEAARTQAKKTLTRAARAQAPAPRPVGQGAGGALRAPSVGTQPVRPTPTNVAPRTNIPGSPLATDYALSRQTGMTQALGQARKAGRLTSGTARSVSGLIGKAGGLLGPLGLVTDAIYTGQDLKSSLDRGEGFARIPGLVQKLFNGDKKDTTSVPITNKNTQARNMRRGTAFGGDPLSRRDQYGGSRDMDAGPGRVSFMSERTAPAVLNGVPGIVDVNPETGKMLPGTWRRGDMDAGPGLVSEMNDPSQADYIAPPPAPILPPPSNLPPEDRAYQREVARTQQMMAANPYMPQMSLYAQGQAAMQTPEDMAATRDLGLAINRAMYGDMTIPKTANPLMAGLNPPGAAQPVIPMDEEGRIGQLDTAAEGVQDFMRKYAEGMKKRKGEE